jgi:hypothetical protein
MLEKLKKLLKGDDPENIKLANHLVDSRLSKDNLIGVICILRINDSEILDNSASTQIIRNLLETHDTRIIKKINSEDLRSYGPKDLYELSLNYMRSEGNIKYATEYYINYINGLTEDALQILLDEELTNEAFSV